MKRFSLAVLLILPVLFLSAANTQTDPVVQKIIKIGTTDNQVMDHLDILSNRIGGRLIGSAAYEDAEKWAAYEFKKWGLEVEMDETGELPVGFNRGPWFGRMLSEDGMILHFVTPSYTAGTKGVQRGPVLIEPKTQRGFDNMKGAMKGAWILISGFNNGKSIDWSEEADQKRAKIIEENTEIEKKNSAIRRENRQNRDKPEAQKELIPLKEEPALFYKQMKEAGILGIIQSAPVPLRATRHTENLLKLTWDTLPTVPDIRLDENQYKIIKKKVEERRYFLLEFDIRNHFRMGPVKYHNVIGIIRGTEFPDEYVIVSGHLDAYDVATGGIDCGVGVTNAMEAARLIMQAGGTDSGPYAQKGVPTMGIEGGYPRGDNFSYGEIWHTERDLYNKMIPDYQKHSSVVTAVIAYGVANLDHLLSRDGYYIIKEKKEEKKK